MRKLRSGEIVNHLRSGAVFFTKCTLGWTLSLEGSGGEEWVLWGTVSVNSVALKAWACILRLYFWTGLGLNTENLFTAPFSNHSIKTTVKSGHRNKRGDCHTTETIAVMLFEGPDLLPPKSSNFLHLEFFSDLRNLQLLNLTTFGWAWLRRRLKQYIFKWLQSYMCGRGGHCHGNLGETNESFH